MNTSDHVLRQHINHLSTLLPLALVIVSILSLLAAILAETYGVPIEFTISFFHIWLAPLLAYLILRRMASRIDEYTQAALYTHHTERRLAAAVQCSADAIITTDEYENIETWNQGAELLFGYEAGAIMGCPLFTLFGSGSAGRKEAGELIETVRRHGFVRKQEMLCIDAAGCLIQIELTATRLNSDHEQASGISLIMRDITTRKQLEENSRRIHLNTTRQAEDRAHQLAEKIAQLAQANEDLLQLDQTRSEFVSLISHQIRAPLTNMAGAVQRMQIDCGSANPTCSRMFAIFEEQVARLDRLVHDVLNVARIEAGGMVLDLEPVSILPIARHAIQLFSVRLSPCPIHLAEKPGLPMTFADRDRIIDVLSNLIDNAHKYSPEKGEIHLEARADQHEITISVQDKGPGLAEKDIERIFEKFYRSDSSDSQSAYGYGLGLYVCRRIVEAHGGRIWAENHPDGGAVFSFSLPVWEG